MVPAGMVLANSRTESEDGPEEVKQGQLSKVGLCRLFEGRIGSKGENRERRAKKGRADKMVGLKAERGK